MSYDLVWVAADGRIVELKPSNGVEITKGALGLDAPPVELNTAARTAGDGSVLVKRRNADRNVALPMFVDTADGSLRDKIDELSDVFRGPGTLRVSRDGGSTFRDLRQVFYEVGLEGDESKGTSMPDVWRMVVVSLRALDPWWYAASVTESVSLGGSTTFDDASVDFDDADTQFNGGDASVFQVAGRSEACPLWTVTGPFDSLRVEVAGGARFELAAALAGGSVITVDTRPGVRGPSLNGGDINWGLLTADSRMPKLPNGSVSVSVLATGTTGASSITAMFEPRWLTP